MAKKRVISVDEGHGSLNYDRICPQCHTNGTILDDGGWEYCSKKTCKWACKGNGYCNKCKWPCKDNWKH